MARELIDLTGKQFGRWTVLGYAGKSESNVHYWSCQCECGTIRKRSGSNIKGEASSSCGCLAKELVAERSTIHGHYRGDKASSTLKSWEAMIRRCTNPQDKRWHWYGERGIAVCQRWLNSFNNFLADMGEMPEGYSIERRNVNLGYSPENCEWIPKEKQARNRRDNLMLIYQGETRCLADWADILGFNVRVVAARLRAGWSTEKAFTETEKHCIVTFNSESRTLGEWAKIVKLPCGVLYNRLVRGWSTERAFTQPLRESPKNK